MKTCSKCKSEMALDLFGTDRSKRDGLRPDCKRCQWAARDKARARASNAKWRSRNLHKARAMEATWRSRNDARIKLKRQLLYTRNKETILAKNKAWARENPQRTRELTRKWELEHPEFYRARNAKRRAMFATPVWSETKEIQAFYRHCPDGYEVDHVIPLGGKTVCGLHVIANLQYLTATENRKKSAKYG